MSKYGGAGEAYALLEKKYKGTAYAVLPEVANGAGAAAGRWLDAIVASLWPSRGLWLHGFEIKCSRHDWQRELAQGEKADAYWKHLDYFSLLTVGPILEPGELPPTWGHVEADIVKGKLRTVVEAPKIAHGPDIGRHLDRNFVMAVLRNVEKVELEKFNKRAMEEYVRGEKDGQQRATDRLADRSNQALKNQLVIDAFQAAHGLASYSLSEKDGAALGALLKAYHDNPLHFTLSMKTAAQLRAAADLIEQLQAFKPNP